MNRQLALTPDGEEQARLAAAQRRIRAMWRKRGTPTAVKELMNSNGGGTGFSTGGNVPGVSTYSAADLTMTTGDFLGDWRSNDSWQRFDMLRVRSRSRQLERGNGWCISFKKALIKNIIGHSGFKLDPNVIHSQLFGDGAEGTVDAGAVAMIKRLRKIMEKPENFTTQKRLAAIDVDALLISRLCFDGEIILRKIRRFENEMGFTWQIINPDFLDHNLNRIESGFDQDGKKVAEPGNITRMGVELDKTYRFPVAYWFFYRRPNDNFYNWNEYNKNLYYRVPAEEVIHRFISTEDESQTRGWPWIFAVAVNLFRLGKFEEAAVVNAAIGASKMGFFKKIIPEGFAGDIQQLKDGDEGSIIDEVSPGSWQELPWNVEPVEFNPKYPDEQFATFEKAMLLGFSACMGSSYMSVTGDVSDANFSSLRAAKDDEQEYWMWLQNWFVRNWKAPEYDEFIYRSILSRRLPLPLAKLDKFTDPKITGRRWGYVNPVDDLRAKQMALAMRITSVRRIIEEQGGDRDEIFAELSRDTKDLEEMGIPLALGKEDGSGQQPDPGDDDPSKKDDGKSKPKPKKKDDKTD